MEDPEIKTFYMVLTSKEKYDENLEEVKKLLKSPGRMQERADMHFVQENWSGDLFESHQRYFQFIRETSMHPGDSGSPGPTRAQLYEFRTSFNHLGGTQCLSVVLQGEHKSELHEKLYEHGFTRNKDHLTEQVNVHPSQKRSLWLEDTVEFVNPVYYST